MNLFVNFSSALVPEDRTGLLSEAVLHFGPARKVYVLVAEGDLFIQAVTLPRNAEIIVVHRDGSPACTPRVADEDIFILNGGMAAQLACMMVHLSNGCAIGHVINMHGNKVVPMAKKTSLRDTDIHDTLRRESLLTA